MPGKFWTGSWSPSIGCSKGLPCEPRCWARRMVSRMCGAEVLDWDRAVTVLEQGHWSGRRILVERWLYKPLKWRKPRVVAVGWLGDMWGAQAGMIDRVMSVASRRDVAQHQFLFLTKQAEMLADNWRRCWYCWFPLLLASGVSALPNLWTGVTITCQADADERIPHLRQIPGRRWLCIEPILGPVALPTFGVQHPLKPIGVSVCATLDVDWIVVGQEAGPGARPARPEWIQSVIDQCRMFGVPVWVKALPKGMACVRQAPAAIAAILRADKNIAAECAKLGVEVEG